MKHLSRIRSVVFIVLIALSLRGNATLAAGLPSPNSAINKSLNTPGADTCQLHSAHGDIQHVIVIMYDNVHLTRDNPNVPSDLEQLPHLLNFIEQNGVMLGNHHTPLISHTGTDLVTMLTGVYPDRHGAPVSNTSRYFLPDGSSNPSAAFGYWTDPIYDPAQPANPTDTTYNMLTADGHNAPAPWVPFTRAGCNFGAVAMSNVVLHRPDIARVFGNPSPEYSEYQSNPDLSFTDFNGIALHCAAGASLCADSNHGRPDILPDEPGGYAGFNALYGAKYVYPQLGGTGTGNETLYDLFGQPIINRISNTPGFTGFDMAAPVTLANIAYMQEHGVPITYGFIADIHDKHPDGTPYGPGEAGYVAALKSDDDAFNLFFTRLANDGINASNTLFIFMADENDHFAGGTPLNACDGVNTACTYSHVTCPTAQIPTCPSDNVGALGMNMGGLLATEQGITTPFAIRADFAPTLYINGNPAPDDPMVTRPFGRAITKLTGMNFYKGKTENLTFGLANPVEMKLLHMLTADPARTPTLTWFSKPDYFVNSLSSDCNSPCTWELTLGAWTHGGATPDITTTWLGMVGPGVKNRGRDDETWSDHTDIRPTMLALVGLEDDYVSDGRVLFEELRGFALPTTLRKNRDSALAVAQVYKQINAPVGALGMNSLKISTRALASGDSGNDQIYTRLEKQLTDLTVRRDALAHKMIRLLNGAAFNGKGINPTKANKLVAQGKALLDEVAQLCAGQKCQP